MEAGSIETRYSHCAAALVLTGLFVLIGSGCDESGGYTGPTGTVQGTVTYGGRPLPDGCRIRFYQPETGYSASGAIAPSGHFALATPHGDRIPVGRYQISIAPPEQPSPDDAHAPAPMLPKYETLPAKFLEYETSELSRDVKEGENTVTLDLQQPTVNL